MISLLSLADLIVVTIALLAAFIFLFSRSLATSSAWRATITPLASIMGSGFLVCAPLLYSTVGNSAVFAMGGLLLLAYGIGAVVRFNIRYAEPLLEKHISPGDRQTPEHPLHKGHWAVADRVSGTRTLDILETTSHLILTAAYCISVSYYLQLLSHFALHSVSWQSTIVQNALVTALLLGIGTVGVLRGLNGIERLERIVVGLNLALILSLIAGLAYFNGAAVMNGAWSLSALPLTGDDDHRLRVLMGLLIVVQGFESSRFLGAEHSADERIRTMRWAQIISSVIYLVFIALMALVIGQTNLSTTDSGITAIITLTALVAPVLPLMITLTAIGSQFSAATADNAGCAGLIQSFIKRRERFRIEYALVAVLSIALTWLTNVYEIISIASRAFALYYMLQCLVALVVAVGMEQSRMRAVRLCLFAGLGALCAAVVIYGIPAG